MWLKSIIVLFTLALVLLFGLRVLLLQKHKFCYSQNIFLVIAKLCNEPTFDAVIAFVLFYKILA